MDKAISLLKKWQSRSRFVWKKIGYIFGRFDFCPYFRGSVRECFVVRRFIPIFLSIFLLFLCFLPRIVSFVRPIGDFSVRRERVVGESSHCFIVQFPLLRQVLAGFTSSWSKVRRRRELACGVWKGGCPSFFCFSSSRAKSRATRVKMSSKMQRTTQEENVKKPDEKGKNFSHLADYSHRRRK